MHGIQCDEFYFANVCSVIITQCMWRTVLKPCGLWHRAGITHWSAWWLYDYNVPWTAVLIVVFQCHFYVCIFTVQQHHSLPCRSHRVTYGSENAYFCQRCRAQCVPGAVCLRSIWYLLRFHVVWLCCIYHCFGLVHLIYRSFLVATFVMANGTKFHIISIRCSEHDMRFRLIRFTQTPRKCVHIRPVTSLRPGDAYMRQ